MAKEYPVAYRKGARAQVDGTKRLGFQAPLVPEIALPTTAVFRQVSRQAVVEAFGRRAVAVTVARAAMSSPVPYWKAAGAGALLLLTFWPGQIHEEPDPDALEPGDPMPYDLSAWYHHVDPQPVGPWDHVGSEPSYWQQNEGDYYFIGTDYTRGRVPGNINVPGVWWDARTGQPVIAADTELVQRFTSVKLWNSDYNIWEYETPGTRLRFGEYWHRVDTSVPAEWIGPTKTYQDWFALPGPIVDLEVSLPWREWHRPGTPDRQVGYEVPFDTPVEFPGKTRPIDIVLTIDVFPPTDRDPGVDPAEPVPEPTDHEFPPPPSVHENAPPSRGEKERKTVANLRSGSLLGTLVGHVTEGLDFLEAVFDALPPEFKPGWYKIHGKGGKEIWVKRWQASPQQMADALWEHFGELDINAAIYNLIANQLEDAFYGKLGKRAQQLAGPLLEQLGRPVGFGTGPAM